MHALSKTARRRLKSPLTLAPSYRRWFQFPLTLLPWIALMVGIGILLDASGVNSNISSLGLVGHAVDWWSHSQSGKAMSFLTLALVGAIVVLCMVISGYGRRLRFRTEYLKTALGTVNELQDTLFGITTVLQDTSGGIHKRIDEIREVAEAIAKHQPDLFERVPGLLIWLRAEDEFLCTVRDQAFPAGYDSIHDELRELFSYSPRKADIFQTIEQLKCPSAISPSN